MDIQTTDAMELLEGGMLKIGDAVAFSGLGRTRIYDAMSAGRLSYVQYGRRRLIPKKALLLLLAEGLIEAERSA